MLEPHLPHLTTPSTATAWQKRATQTRQHLLEHFFVGHPSGLLEEQPRVQWRGTIETGEGYRIRKLRYEGYPGMWVPALLYEPTVLKGRVPVVLNPNGHHAGGKAMDYKQARCIRRGPAPQTMRRCIHSPWGICNRFATSGPRESLQRRQLSEPDCADCLISQGQRDPLRRSSPRQYPRIVAA